MADRKPTHEIVSDFAKGGVRHPTSYQLKHVVALLLELLDIALYTTRLLREQGYDDDYQTRLYTRVRALNEEIRG